MIMITPSQQDKIDEILDEFDFPRVHMVMEHLEWKWSTIAGVPSIGDLRRAARNHLNALALRRATSGPWEHNTMTGGLSASRWGNTDEFGPWENFGLEFVLEHWRTEEPEGKQNDFSRKE
jgi:hypothetical protein